MVRYSILYSHVKFDASAVHKQSNKIFGKRIEDHYLAKSLRIINSVYVYFLDSLSASSSDGVMASYDSDNVRAIQNMYCLGL